MKATIQLGLTFISIAAAAVVTGQALATTHARANAPTTLRVVMRDPGCHWFSVGGKFRLTTTAAGRVKLVNYDEATLKVAGTGLVQRIPVGKSIILGRGRYAITMVGQAPDDNHLKLTVR